MTDLLYIVIGSCLLMVLGILFMMYIVYRQLRELHITMNSRLDQLISVTKDLARSEGFRAGQENHLSKLRDFEVGKDNG